MFAYIIIAALILIFLVMYKYSRNDHRSRQYKQKRKIKKLTQKCDNHRINLFDILELARYHHIGVDDKYTPDGELIKGIKPDAAKAIRYYTIAGKLGYTKAYYEIGMIHENGCGDYDGSLPAALEYYKLIYKKGYIRNNAIIAKIRELDYAINHNRISTGIINGLREPKQKIISIGIQRAEPQLRNNDDFDPVFDQALEDAIIRATQTMTAPTPMIGQVYSDAQNTHDTTINSTIRDALAKIEGTKLKIDNNAIHEVEAFIKENLQKDKQKNALLTLQKIKEHNSTISSVNKTEQDVLNLVWSRINSPDNEKYNQQLKENLCDYLAESVENGRVCCATGRVNRIVDSLNTVDPLVTIKSTTMINQELMNKAGVIRNKLYENLPDEEKKIIDLPDDSPQSTKFAETTKNEILKMVNDEYVAPGVLNEETATKLTSQWIDAL